MYDTVGSQFTHLRQLFFKNKGVIITLVGAKIVDYFKVSCEGHYAKHFTNEVQRIFKFGYVNKDLGELGYFAS